MLPQSRADLQQRYTCWRPQRDPWQHNLISVLLAVFVLEERPATNAATKGCEPHECHCACMAACLLRKGAVQWRC